ncbi:MAG: hypothetical protein SF029_06740 [bacterium]|nr:hypothetical protein [bacterium]
MDIAIFLAQATPNSGGSTILSIFYSILSIAYVVGAVRTFSRWLKKKPFDLADKVIIAFSIPIVIVIVIFMVMVQAQGSSKNRSTASKPIQVKKPQSVPINTATKVVTPQPQQKIVTTSQPSLRTCPQCSGQGKVSRKQSVPCTHCNGKGGTDKNISGWDHQHNTQVSYNEFIKCRYCGGTGSETRMTQVNCSKCNGLGKIR